LPTVKESSDELNPTVETQAHVAHASKRRTAGDYVALAVATCGVGYLPLAPGTWGSLVGVAVYVLFDKVSNRLLMDEPLWLSEFLDGAPADLKLAEGLVHASLIRTSILIIIIATVTFLGVWAATRTEKLTGRKDPKIVVIDEVAGQLLAFLFMPWRTPLWVIALGFLLFRLFDIWKPYPVRRLEALESGLGIMADDVLAGFYAATVLSLVTSLWLLF
jgi:phosphatidylglycerophosphatase A